MAATIARLARMANVFTAYVNLNVELASSRAGELGLARSGLYLQPLFHSPVLCSPPAVFVFTLVVLSPSPITPLLPKPKRNLLALICYTLACPASFSPLPTFLPPLPALCFHLRCPPFSCVCVHFLYGIFTLRSAKKREERK